MGPGVKLAAAAVATMSLLSACSPASGAEATVTLNVEHSSFDPAKLKFAVGDTVRFVVVNSDPIDHELIIGDQQVQDVHERGTERHHDAKPGEVSVPAGETVETTYRFDEPGGLIFGCHLPGHYDFGMKGTITVTG